MMVRNDYLPFGRPSFTGDEIEAVSRALTGGWIGMGPEAIAFENELAACTGASHVVTLNSCNSALLLAFRDELILALRAKNIGASIHYAPLHLMPLYHKRGKPEPLPVTERVSKSLVTLPISASMTEGDARYVAGTVNELMGR